MKTKRFWIKLYLEILDDPKMGLLPDWLWRRAIELFLLAGENGNDGLLQPVTDLAWRLRVSTEKAIWIATMICAWAFSHTSAAARFLHIVKAVGSPQQTPAPGGG